MVPAHDGRLASDEVPEMESHLSAILVIEARFRIFPVEAASQVRSQALPEHSHQGEVKSESRY